MIIPLVFYSLSALCQKDTIILANYYLTDSHSHRIDSLPGLSEYNFSFSYLREFQIGITFISPLPYFSKASCGFHLGGKYKLTLLKIPDENALPYSYHHIVLEDSTTNGDVSKKYKTIVPFNDLCKVSNNEIWNMLRIADHGNWYKIISIDPCECNLFPK